MSDRVTIGQYISADTPIHHLDSRVKILLTIAYIVSVFLIETYLGYLAAFSMVMGVMFLGQVPAKRLFKGLRPLFAIVLLTFIINVLTTPGNVVASFWIFTITDAGLSKAVFIAIRIMLLVLGTSLLTFTTSPLALTDGLEALMKPLKVIRFPAHELAMMISIALRFIPTLFDESDKIMRAQKARGADFESGNILRRAKAMIPLMVPLFLNAFHRAEELGTAMEARCYRGGAGRTRLNPLNLTRRDVLVLLFSLTVLIVLCWFW